MSGSERKGGRILFQKVSISEHLVQVAFAGSIYVEEANEIQEELHGYIDNGHLYFSIDLSEVDYIDSTGLGALVGVNRRAMRKGGVVKIEGIHGLVKELFELSRLNKVFG